MTFLPRWPQIFVALLLGLGPACVTVVPMQTASVVPLGAYRVGGSSTVSGYCSLSLGPVSYLAGNRNGMDACNAIPLGVPSPELRLGARHGLAEGLDLGASVQGEITVPRGYQVGMFVDVKKELWSRPLDAERRQLVSVGPGVGYTSTQVTSRPDEPGVGMIDLALPIYFGHQTGGFELVGAVKYLERLLFADQNRDGRRELLAAGELVFSFGFFGRGRTRFGMELSYQTAVVRPSGGLFNVSAGVTWDIGLPDPAPPAR